MFLIQNTKHKTVGPTPMDPEDKHHFRLKKIPREDEIIDGIAKTNRNIGCSTPPAFAHTSENPMTTDKEREESMQSFLLNGGSKNTNNNDIIQPSNTLKLTYDDITELSENDKDDPLNLTQRFKPAMISTNPPKPKFRAQDTDLQQHLTPIEAQNKQTVSLGALRLAPKSYTEPETPLTPEPDTVTVGDGTIGLETQSDEDNPGKMIVNPGSSNTLTSNTQQRKVMTKLPLSNLTSVDEDELGMEYIEYDDNIEDTATTAKTSRVPTPKRGKNGFTSNTKERKTVRFVETVTDKEKDKPLSFNRDDSQPMDIPHDTPSHKPQPPPRKKMTMHDLLGGAVGVGTATTKPVQKNNSDKKLNLEHQQSRTNTQREESVVSKAEPSWFAAWFRKGNPVGCQQERADTLLHYSDLSWRRMRKVAKEVNMSALARENVNQLFKIYPTSRTLETKSITISVYDDAMRDAWCSTWENMNDSLRRFAKSQYYVEYLATVGTTIRRLTDDDMAPTYDGGKDNTGIAIRGSARDVVNGGNEDKKGIKESKSKFRMGSIGRKKDKRNKKRAGSYQPSHSRTSPVVI